MTPTQLKVLAYLADPPPAFTASDLAMECFNCRRDGRWCSRQGAGFAAAGMMERLRRLGLVHHDWQSGGWGWKITEEGRAVLRDNRHEETTR